MELHRLLRPEQDVTDEVARARRLAVDLVRCQDSGPELKIRQLPHEGLGDVEAASHCVLWIQEDFLKHESTEDSLFDTVCSVSDSGPPTCSCPRMKIPPGLIECQADRFCPEPFFTPSW